MIDVDVIAVPYDSGRRGYRMGAGPGAFIDGGLAASIRSWGYGTTVTVVESDTAAATADALDSAMELAAGIAHRVREARAAGRLPLVLAGNCISTVGALAGLGANGIGVLWFDAHADLNTPATSTSGFLDGMSAAAALGWCFTDRTRDIPGFRPLPESRLMLVGTRDVDPAERDALERSAVRTLTTDDVRSAASLGDALDAFAGPVEEIFLHLDLDVLDPDRVGPANAFACPDGLSLLEAVTVVHEAGARRRIAGATVSAYDPAVDRSMRVRTAMLPLVCETLIAAEPGGP